MSGGSKQRHLETDPDSTKMGEKKKITHHKAKMIYSHFVFPEIHFATLT